MLPHDVMYFQDAPLFFYSEEFQDTLFYAHGFYTCAVASFDTNSTALCLANAGVGRGKLGINLHFEGKTHIGSFNPVSPQRT